MLSYLLTKNNFRVVQAYSGQTGFEKAEEFQPDIVLLDIQLPDMDGHSICRALRESDRKL